MQIMEDFSLLVAGLDYKVRQLIEKKNSQFAQIQEMEGPIVSLQKENRRLVEELKEITAKKQMLELVGAVESAKDSKRLKLKINEYLRELDKCIAYVNSQ
jgi:predicted RNase H-like nuclease (RuvC/YqgF family)